MAVDVVVPGDLWDDDGEGVVTSWLASDGATVEEGALIVEVMAEKIQYEIVAPASGVLKVIKDNDDVIKKGDVVATIG